MLQGIYVLSDTPSNSRHLARASVGVVITSEGTSHREAGKPLSNSNIPSAITPPAPALLRFLALGLDNWMWLHGENVGLDLVHHQSLDTRN